MSRQQASPKLQPGAQALGPDGGASLRERLRAAVLLSGSVRSTNLVQQLGRSVLDLPIEQGRQLSDLWAEQMGAFVRSIGCGPLPVRLMVDSSSPAPAAPEEGPDASFSVERDPYDYRGTGGVLRDLAADYAEEDYLLVANGAQLMLEPLAALVEELALPESDVTLVGHGDGTPSGLMLVRCGALHPIPETGFIDMKEQGLPTIAEQHDVRVVHRDAATGIPIRMLSDYIRALRIHHTGERHRADPFVEDLTSSFSVVEAGAQVDETALVHDAVVLTGARVRAGAVVVRSVVGEGAQVPPKRHVVDRLVATVRAADTNTGES